MTSDPIRLEIIRHALVAAAEEMSVTVWRTSRSSVVREILDYSTCVFDAKGRSVITWAQGIAANDGQPPRPQPETEKLVRELMAKQGITIARAD